MDYISNPDRQEHLYAVCDTTVDERFWDYLAGENHKAFEQSGARGECIEARELIIMLPPSLREYDPDHEYDEPKQYELREINSIMNNSIIGWEKAPQHRFKEYGRQGSWKRKTDENGFVSLPDNAELPFD